MNVNWNKIRKEQFPALENSIYLKAAGGSPMSKVGYDASLKYLTELHIVGDLFWDQYFDDAELTRQLIANYINCKPHEIAFLMNTSSGMNVIAHILERGRILYPEGEFPTSILIFKKLGFKCDKYPLESDNSYPLDKISNYVKEDTKYIIHSHVQYLTGFKQNLGGLGNFCKKNKYISIINATQSFGAFPIDTTQEKIDILVASGLKWACSGYGLGILYLNDRLIPKEGLSFSSWLSVKDSFSMDNDNLNFINQTKAMDGLGGTPNFASIIALKANLLLIKEIGNGNIREGIKRIRKRIINLTQSFIEQLKETNLKIITPLDIEYRSGIITIESENAKSIFSDLSAKNIQISLRNYPKTKNKTLLRFAFNYYNNEDDIEETISILKSNQKR